MAWLCTDGNGDEKIFDYKPIRYKKESFNFWSDLFYNKNVAICLPKGTIRKIIGRDLTWLDEPIELK